MKRIFAFILGVGLSLLVGGKVLANEGVAEISGESSVGKCFVVSVFETPSYKLLGSCRDLRVPTTAEKTRLILWVNDIEGKVKRVGEIVRGKIDGQVDRAFNSLFVTAETSSYPRNPSEEVVMRGELNKLPIDGGVVIETAPVAEVTPTVTLVPTKTSSSETTGGTSPGTLGKILRTVGRLVVVVFLGLLVVVVVMTVITRRKESKDE